uniref:Solute carrier family 40 member n=1 Tax=Romanomermis culicivorax TaxID=13658 RepID=A0A915K8Q4_ROMCU
ATTVLIANNFAVAFSAGLLVIILLAPHVQYLERFDFSPGHATIITKCLVGGSIFLCAVSTLASCGTKICISKDWVVVMSNGNKELLADINAWMVRLDLTSMILSPLIAGQIMTSFGQAAGCLYIALWNLLSFIVEYFVLRSIYYSCPALAKKSVKLKSKNADKQEMPHVPAPECLVPAIPAPVIGLRENVVALSCGAGAVVGILG